MDPLESNLDSAVSQLERTVGNQLTSIDGLSTKVSVLLGFVLGIFGTLFGIAPRAVQHNLPVALVSSVLLGLAAVMLASSYRIAAYWDVPDPDWLLSILNEPPREMKIQMVQSLAGAYLLNRDAISKRFRRFNTAIVFFLLGVFTFVSGVLLT